MTALNPLNVGEAAYLRLASYAGGMVYHVAGPTHPTTLCGRRVVELLDIRQANDPSYYENFRLCARCEKNLASAAFTL